jgi:teichuronic acid exporter
VTQTPQAADAHHAEPGHGHLRQGRARASVRGAMWSLFNASFGTILAVAVFYVASRFLTPHDFGLVALAVSIVSIASALAPAAFGEALVQRAEVLGAHLDTVFWLCLAAAVVLFLPVVAVAPAAAAWLGEPALALLLPFVGARLFFDMLAVVPHALIVRRMQFRLIALRTVVANGVAAILCLGLLFLGYGFWALAASQVATAVVTALVEFRVAGWRPGRQVGAAALRQLAGYGLWASGSQVLNVLKIDQFLIGVLGGTVMAGLYNFAQRLFQMLTGLISGALASVAHALFASMQAEPEKAREAFLLAIYASAVVAFPIFVGLILVVDPAVPAIFGSQWQPAVTAVRAASVIGILASIGVVQAALVTGHGRTNWWFRYQLAQRVAAALAIVIFLPFGFDAAVTAMAAKSVLIWPVSVAMTIRIIGISAGDYARVLAVPAAATAVMAAVVLAIPALIAEGGGPLAVVGVQVAVGAAVYAAVAGVLSLRRMRRVVDILKGPREARPT